MGKFFIYGAIFTLMIDSYATWYYKRLSLRGVNKQVGVDEEMAEEHGRHVHVHTHAAHGHAHGSSASTSSQQSNMGADQLIRHRIIAQVWFIYN